MLSGFDAAVAGKIANLYDLSYSRKMELQADRIAVDVLAGAQIDSNALRAFFERMARAEPSTGALKYLSSHPDWRERLAAATPRHPRAGVTRPALNDSQWNDLKAICGDKDGPRRRTLPGRQEARL
jgi:predicted Zn-dependent protease